MHTTPPPPEQGQKRPQRRRELWLLLLALLLSFGCVFCSTWGIFLDFWPDRLTEASLLAGRQANYRGGPETIRFGVLDPAIAAEAATDLAQLYLTPVSASPGTPVSIKPFPATPTAPPGAGPPVIIQPTPTWPHTTPTPSPPTTPVPVTSTPKLGPTATPAVGSPVPTLATGWPSPTQLPTSTPPATATPVAPPTSTLPPTAVPDNTATPNPTPPPSDDDDDGGGSSPPNTPPVVVDDAAGTNEDTPVAVAVLANDTDSDGTLRPDTVSVVSAPANGTTWINTGSGQITYTPALNFSGSDTFTYRACDDRNACGTAVVTLTVNPVNDPPSAIDDALTTVEDTLLTAAILANDYDVEGDPISVLAISPPYTGTIVLNPDGTLSYTPPLDFFGVVSLTYTIQDSQALTNSATLVITVTPVNDPPVAVDDATFTAEDTGEDFDVCGNDTDVEGDPLTVVAVGPAAHGSATSSGCLVTYHPQPNFYGDDVFSYTVSDGVLTDTARITITVAAVNDLPVAVADAYTTTQDTALTVLAADGVLANDYDVDAGDTLSADLVNSPVSGSLTLNTDGAFVYTPAPGFMGVDTFAYRALDGLLAPSNVVSVTITISATP